MGATRLVDIDSLVALSGADLALLYDLLVFALERAMSTLELLDDIPHVLEVRVKFSSIDLSEPFVGWFI